MQRTKMKSTEVKCRIHRDNMKNKKNNGITLIVLVITIVVLLILAGVTIATLTGENGILTRASEAKEKSEKSQDEELRRLTALEASTNLENYIYKDKNGDIATIPAGFAVSQIDGENIIDEGLVIIDSEGNEFVWIPVASIDDLVTKIEGTDNNANQNYQGKLYTFTSAGEAIETTSFREPDIVSNYDDNSTYLNIIKGILTEEENANKYANMNSFKTTMQEDYNKMIKSVQQYHGFYISRYEMSKSTTIPKAASIANVRPLVNDTNNRWYGLYAYGKTYSTDSVESSMIWGSQYDAMLKWMQSGENKVNVARDIGESRNRTETTGNTLTDVIRNIYDLYGCNREWTLAAYNTSSRVSKGRYEL